MTRNHTIVLLLVGSLALTAIFIFGSFVNYAQPISSTDMQNIYLARIMKFGAATASLHLVCLVLALTDRRPPNVP